MLLVLSSSQKPVLLHTLITNYKLKKYTTEVAYGITFTLNFMKTNQVPQK
jgi:hypothetical protein